MTEITPTRETDRYNREIYASAEHAGVRTKEIRAEMDDPSLGQVRKAQESDLSQGALALTASGVRYVLATSPGALGFAAGAAAPLVMAVKLGSKLLAAHDEGAALTNARARDAMHLAVLNLASAELPLAFVQQRAHGLRQSQHGAGQILADFHALGKHAAVKAKTEEFTRQGAEAARQRHIVDAKSLAAARQDPKFEADYQNNVAFQLGVDAVIYRHAQAEH